MNIWKLLTIAVDVTLGFFVTGIMILMLPMYLAIPFGLWSAWMWCAAPLLLLWAKKKEDEKSLDSP